YLGLAIAGFPNLFVANVPVFSASTPRAEWTGTWLRDCLSYMRDHAFTRIEPTTEAEDRWVEHHEELASKSFLGGGVDSWYVGANFPGRRRRCLVCGTWGPAWYAECCEAEEKGYGGFELSRRSEPPAAVDENAAPAVTS